MVQTFRKLFWTEHSKIKMRQYGLSKQKLLGILYKPERREQGIVPGTRAMMKTNKIFLGPKKITISGAWQKPRRAPGEIWLMYKDVKMKGVHGAIPTRKIISAWRYPGISKTGEAIPIPEDIRLELENNNGDE